MSSNFRIYDPVAQLIATGGGGGGGLPSTGGTMTGNLNMQAPFKVVQCELPTNPCDLANMAYVDAQVAAGTPDATTILKGKLKLAGDFDPTSTADIPVIKKATGSVYGTIQLGGDLDPTSSATAPLIKLQGVTNPKILPGAVNTLKGTNSTTSVDDIILGSGLSMSAAPGPTLSVNPATLNKSGAAQFGVVQFDPVLGDLDPTSANSGIGQVKALAISTAKIANLAVTTTKIADANVSNSKILPGGVSTLKGTNSLTNVDDIILGSGLSLTVGAGPTLSVNSATLNKAGAAQFGVVQFDAGVGDLDPTSANSGIGQVKALAISTGKIANTAVSNPKILPGASSTLKGTNSLTNVDDIILGSGLSLTAGAGPTLSVNSSALNKAGAAQFGVVEFDSAVGDLVESSANSGIGQVKPKAITLAKMADLSTNSKLIGSAAGSNVVTELTLGSGLSVTASTINVDTTTLPVIPVSKGGTGATTLTGYLKGNGTSPVTAVSSIPLLDVTGAVGFVNGIPPDAGRNVTVLLGNVTTGVLAALPPQPVANGNIYVVSGDPTPANNGRTYISDGSVWREVTANQAATDARYVIKTGDTMTGDLTMQSLKKVIQTQAPTNPDDLTNKLYVDTTVASGTPDATTILNGKIRLAGDFDPTSTAAVPIIKKATSGVYGTIQLGGDLDPTSSATAPLIKLQGVTNPKILPGAVNTLKGTNSLTNVDDIILGSGLSLTAGAGPTLSVNSATLNKAGAAQFGVVQFDAGVGDLDPTSANSGIGQIKPLAISTGKIANTAVSNPKILPGASSTLKGTNSLTNVDDIILGSGLSLTVGAGPTLSVNSSALNKAGAAQFGVVQFDPALGDLDPTSANSGIGQVKALAISTAKIANLAVTTAKIADANVTNPKILSGGVSTLKGTNSLSNVDDIILGSGLSLTAGAGPTLSVDSSVLGKAGAAQFGVIQFDPAIGDLDPTSANSGIGQVKALAISTAKIANTAVTNPKVNPGGASTLKGTNSLTNVDDIILGSGLSLTAGAGPTLSIDSSTLNKAGAAQFGVVQFDPALGDLDPTSANSGIGQVKALAITTGKIANLAVTNAKLANMTAVSQLKGSNSASMAVTDISLNSPSMTMSAAGVLSSAISFVAGPNPNLIAPTDRPSTSNIAYIGNNGSVWLWNGSIYTTLTPSALTGLRSTTVYTILGSNVAAPPISMTDYSVAVNPGQSVKINYSWNYQSAGGGTAYAPSFGWSGVTAGDAFQAHIPGLFNNSQPRSTSIYDTTPPTLYTLQATDADTNFIQSLTLAIGGLNAPSLAIYCNVYYKNNGGSVANLIPLFNRDLKTATGITIQIAGGWMDYSYF